jgi:integration host factor subunit alpha
VNFVITLGRGECLFAEGTIPAAFTSSEDDIISGFGKFNFREKNARKGRNPATGEDLMPAFRKVVTFKCSGKLRDRINGN